MIFAAILMAATFLTGIIWLVDLVFLKSKKKA